MLFSCYESVYPFLIYYFVFGFLTHAPVHWYIDHPAVFSLMHIKLLSLMIYPYCWSAIEGLTAHM